MSTDTERIALLESQLARLINCANSVALRLPEYPPLCDAGTAKEFLIGEIKRAENILSNRPACIVDSL